MGFDQGSQRGSVTQCLLPSASNVTAALCVVPGFNVGCVAGTGCTLLVLEAWQDRSGAKLMRAADMAGARAAQLI